MPEPQQRDPAVQNTADDVCLSSARIARSGAGFQKLERRWTFPSDHLPVAAEVYGLRIGTWNVLNAKWVHHFMDDNEGLAASAIVTGNRPLTPQAAWTRREERTLQITFDLARKLHMLALQECSPAFISRLEHILPPNISLLRGRSDNPDNDIVLLYNRRKLQINQARSRIHEEGYRCKAGKAVMDLWLEPGTSRPVRLIHTHVPGDPSMPGLDELGGYLRTAAVSPVPIVLAGDLNFPEERIRAVFADVRLPAFLRITEGNTTVGAGGAPKAIDHILAFNLKPYFCRPLSAEYLGPPVAQAFELINSCRK